MPRDFTYPFFTFPNSNIGQPVLPLRITNPHCSTNNTIKWHALVDTGADSCLFTKEICLMTNHNFDGKDVLVQKCQGIGDRSIKTFSHTFILELMDPANNESVWSSGQIPVECSQSSSSHFPLLLGTKDFLEKFKIVIDYPNQCITVVIY